MAGEKRSELKKGGAADVVAGVVVLIVGGYLFNAYVLSDSAPGNAPETPSVPYEAITTCQNHFRAQASHPSTVTFPIGTTSTDTKAPGGGYRVRIGFTAKNGFGLETRYDALCKFKPGSLVIDEAGAWEKASG